jgi:plastocyanin
MPKIPLLTAGATALALGLAACGGSSSSSSQSSSAAGGSTSAASSASGTSSAASSSSAAPTSSSAAPSAGGGALALAANPSGQLKFSVNTLAAKAGKVKIDFTNMSPVGHNLTIEQGTAGPVVGATPTFSGGSKTLTVKLKPGTYTFFCSVPGHRMAGMQGTLTVQ